MAIIAAACVDPVQDNHGNDTLGLGKQWKMSEAACPPDHSHDDDHSRKLEDNTQPHDILRTAGAAAAQHVDEAKRQNDGNGANGNGNDDVCITHSQHLARQ